MFGRGCTSRAPRSGDEKLSSSFLAGTAISQRADALFIWYRTDIFLLLYIFFVEFLLPFHSNMHIVREQRQMTYSFFFLSSAAEADWIVNCSNNQFNCSSLVGDEDFHRRRSLFFQKMTDSFSIPAVYCWLIFINSACHSII